MRMESIVWQDIVTSDGWDKPTNLVPEDGQAITIGYVTEEDDEFVYLAATISRDPEAPTNQRIMIPKGCILERKQIRVDDQL